MGGKTLVEQAERLGVERQRYDVLLLCHQPVSYTAMKLTRTVRECGKISENERAVVLDEASNSCIYFSQQLDKSLYCTLCLKKWEHQTYSGNSVKS